MESGNRASVAVPDSDPVMRAIGITVLIDLVAVAGTALWLLPFTVPLGLFAGQTGFLAIHLALGDGSAALRRWNALVGLALHVAVIAILSSPVGIEWGVVSFAALGTAMAGVALMTWIVRTSGLAFRLDADGHVTWRLRFSIVNLMAATTLASTLALLNRWAVAFGEVSQWQLLSFAAHQTTLMTMAVVCFGSLRRSQLSSLVLVSLAAIAGILLDRLFSSGRTGAVHDFRFPFFAFEVAQASILSLWLSAVRRTIESNGPLHDAPAMHR